MSTISSKDKFISHHISIFQMLDCKFYFKYPMNKQYM